MSRRLAGWMALALAAGLAASAAGAETLLLEDATVHPVSGPATAATRRRAPARCR